MTNIAGALLPLMIQGTVLGVFVLAVQAVLRKRLPPQWNVAMWALVFLKFLIPIRIQSAISAFGPVAHTQGWQRMMGAAIPPIAPLGGQDPAVLASMAPQATSLPQGMPGVGGAIDPALSPASIDWMAVLAWIWVIGAVVLALLYMRQYYLLKIDIYRNRSTFEDDRIEALARDCFRAAGISPDTEVVFTAHAKSPFVFGLGRALIAMPGHLVEHLDDDDLRAVLLHEATHIRRNHHRLRFALSLIAIAYWWNPLVWLFSARVNREMEFDCDYQALHARAGCDQKAYADALVRLAGLQRSGGYALTLSFGESSLKGRVLAVLENRTFGRTVSIVALAMIAVTAVAFFTMPSRRVDPVAANGANGAEGSRATANPLPTATPSPMDGGQAAGAVGDGHADARPTLIPAPVQPTSTPIDGDDSKDMPSWWATSQPTGNPVIDIIDHTWGRLLDLGERWMDNAKQKDSKHGITANGAYTSNLSLLSDEWKLENILPTIQETQTKEIAIADGEALFINVDVALLEFQRYDGDTLRVDFMAPSRKAMEEYTFALRDQARTKIVDVTLPNVDLDPAKNHAYAVPKIVRVSIPHRVRLMRAFDLNASFVKAEIEQLAAKTFTLDDAMSDIRLEGCAFDDIVLTDSMGFVSISQYQPMDSLTVASSMSNIQIIGSKIGMLKLDDSMGGVKIGASEIGSFEVETSMGSVTLQTDTFLKDSSIDSSMGSATVRTGRMPNMSIRVDGRGSSVMNIDGEGLLVKGDDGDSLRIGNGTPCLSIDSEGGAVSFGFID